MSIRQIVIVPHTHWDREWYEPECVFRIALVDAVDRAVELIERGDLPVFLLDGQAAILEDYLRIRPEQTERVRALADDEKLLVGPWYVLADELLTGDEALVRNLLTGRSTAERFGRWLPVGYSPDAFGHPAALPSILRGFGIENAIIWRGYGGEPGQRGDVFEWEAPDGARVLTHHLPPDGYEVGRELPVGDSALAARWNQLRSIFASRAETGVVLLLNGADHHAPQSGLREVQRGLERHSGAAVSIASPEAYFAAIAGARVPAVRGELRFSYRYSWTLQGVHATRSRLKRLIAEAEQLLTRWVEPQLALGGAGSKAVLDQLWRDHLASCAHDSLGGCCADEVARDVERRASGVIRAARRAWVAAALERAGHDRVAARRQPNHWCPSWIVVNPTPHARGGVVEATLTFKVRDVKVGPPRDHHPPALDADSTPPPTPTVRDHDGRDLPLQVLQSSVGFERIDSPRDYPDQDVVHQLRVAVWVPAVPALGLRGFRVETGSPGTRTMGAESVRANGRGIRSLQWDVRESPRGFRIDARSDARRWTDVGDVVSEGDAGDTYTFEPEGSPMRAQWSDPEILHAGPLVAVVARSFEIRERAHGVLYVRLAASSDLVWVTIEGENVATGHRLRIHVPVGEGDTTARSLPAVADMHYGAVARSRETYDRAEFPWEWPVSTAPMHRFVSVGGANGMTVFARGAFEYEHEAAGGLYVTVLRAVDQLSRDDLQARPGNAGWPLPTPEARELGPFRLELGWWGRGITLDAAPDEWHALQRMSEAFHAPLAGIGLRSALNVPRTAEGPQLVGNGLAVRAVKRADGSEAMVLRCVNLTGKRVRGAWVWPGTVRAATRARLDETPIGKPIRVSKRRIPFTAAPREIVTMLVTGDLD